MTLTLTPETIAEIERLQTECNGYILDDNHALTPFVLRLRDAAPALIAAARRADAQARELAAVKAVANEMRNKVNGYDYGSCAGSSLLSELEYWTKRLEAIIDPPAQGTEGP